jgi:serine/threonine protein phosphatase PrpC
MLHIACRVNGNLNLSRAIGDLKYKSNAELPPKDQIITAQPDVMRIPLTPEDRFFVLACDGVWDVMSNQVCDVQLTQARNAARSATLVSVPSA